MSEEQSLPEKSRFDTDLLPPNKTKPFMTITVEWKEDSRETFRVLGKHFKDTLVNVNDAVLQVFGSGKDVLGRGVEIAIKGGYGSNLSSKSIFLFFKGAGKESDIHIQGFETPENLLKNKEWLIHHLKKARVKYCTNHESLTPNKSDFYPRGILDFFGKDILSFLSSSILLVVFFAVDLLQNHTITSYGFSSLFAGIVVFLLWVIVTLSIYIRKRKTYVFELKG